MTPTDPLDRLPDDEFNDVVNYFDVLGIDDYFCDTNHVHTKYREQVRNWHPDNTDHPKAGDVMFVLNKARDVLGNDRWRTVYLQHGHQTYITEFAVFDGPRIQRKSSNSPEKVSVYDLIRRINWSGASHEPLWKVILRSQGFHILIGMIGIVAILIGLLVYL